MGLPGFSGFVAELQVLIGAWQAFPTLAVLAGVGIVVGVAYTLRALQKAFFGGRSRTADPSRGGRSTAATASGANLGPGAHRRGAADRRPRWSSGSIRDCCWT